MVSFPESARPRRSVLDRSRQDRTHGTRTLRTGGSRTREPVHDGWRRRQSRCGRPATVCRRMIVRKRRVGREEIRVGPRRAPVARRARTRRGKRARRFPALAREARVRANRRANKPSTSARAGGDPSSRDDERGRHSLPDTARRTRGFRRAQRCLAAACRSGRAASVRRVHGRDHPGVRERATRQCHGAVRDACRVSA